VVEGSAAGKRKKEMFVPWKEYLPRIFPTPERENALVLSGSLGLMFWMVDEG